MLLASSPSLLLASSQSLLLSSSPALSLLVSSFFAPFSTILCPSLSALAAPPGPSFPWYSFPENLRDSILSTSLTLLSLMLWSSQFFACL